MDDDHIRRDVHADEPSLSPEANRLLTEELREVVGDDHVDLPADAPPPHAHPTARHRGWASTLSDNRLTIVITFVLAVVVGAIASLATGSWWLLAVAIVLHGTGTLIVAGMTLGATTETEHASLAVAERLRDEGVADPDRLLTDLAADYDPEAREQRDEVTPSRRSEPVDDA